MAIASHTGWGLNELLDLTTDELLAWHDSLSDWLSQGEKQPQNNR